MTWLLTNRSLKSWDALEQLRAVYSSDKTLAIGRVKRILLRGKSGEIKNSSAVSALAQDLVRVAQREAEDARRINLLTQGQLTRSQQESADRLVRINALTKDVETLAQKLAVAENLLVEKEQHWGHDIVDIKARQSILIRTKLVPLLNDAVDALEVDPQVPQIALKRVKAALMAIEETGK